jgi:PAT family beta-lactamase induction signal transducer AmpG
MPEPQHQDQNEQYSTQDYLGFFALFLILVVVFISTFIFSASLVSSVKVQLSGVLGYPHVAHFIVETLRLISAVFLTFGVAKVLMQSPLINKEMVTTSYLKPVEEFFSPYHLKTALLILALVGLYRISDIVLGVISNVFYQDLGFTKTEIASVVKTFGLFMTIAGGFLGGLITIKIGVIKALMIGAALTIATNLMFVLLAYSGPNLSILYLVISADNLTAGLASAAFIAFLSALTNVKFTAMQYAIFSSLMTLLPKLLGGFSGSIVDSLGYVNFFIFASVIGLPVLVLIALVNKHLTLKDL